MDLTPDGPLGERDKDMNTLPTETVSTTHQCAGIQNHAVAFYNPIPDIVNVIHPRPSSTRPHPVSYKYNVVPNRAHGSRLKRRSGSLCARFRALVKPASCGVRASFT